MRAFVSFLFLIMAVPALAAEIPPEAAAPSVLPGITPAMRSAGYWTARHPAPDAVIMDGVRVMDFNRDLMNEGFVEDFSRPPSVLAGRAVTAMISEINDGLKRKIFFDAKGALVPSGRVAAFDAEIAAVPEKVLVHYGFVTRNTDERLLPMAEPLYEKPGDIDFDQLQNSGLVVGAPVIILHQTRNGKWLFVRDAIASGWVTTDSIGLVDRDMFRERAVPSRPVVVMSARADLFSNSALTQWASMVRMGTVFSYRNVTAAAWEVEVPVRTKEYLSSGLPVARRAVWLGRRAGRPGLFAFPANGLCHGRADLAAQFR